jgi:DNA-binding transcriptional MocR family regulator
MNMMLTIDHDAAKPLYRQVIDGVRDLIDAGTLRPDHNLPSSRRLAAQLGLDRSTVTQAYAELQALGYVRSRPGSYTVVQKRGGTGTGPAPVGRDIDWPDRARPEAEWAGRLFQKNPSEAKARKGAAEDTISLAQLDPDPRLFPLGTIHRTFSRILGGGEAAPFEYGSYQGYPPLREHLARRMRLHGVSAAADEILVTNGAQQALDLLIRVFGRPGRAVVIEAPTYALVIPLLRLNGVEAIAIPMRADGMDLDRLDKVLRKDRVAFVYTMPNFQNPTGITTGHEHRARLLALCRARRVPVVEDGFEEDMKYYGRVDLPIKSMDEGGVVIYVGTFSKALFPGLRVGWIAADRECIRRLTAVKRYTDLTSNHLAQVFMHRFCEDGHYDRHLRRLHRAYRRRLDLTLRTMTAAFPASVTWTEPPGGYTMWVRMPEKMSRAELEAFLEPYGVIVSAGENYFPGGAPSEHFRLCIARTDETEIREGVIRLGRALSDRFGTGPGRKRGRAGR